MDRLFRPDRLTRQLAAPVRDHFVGVGVGRRGGAGLKHVDGKLGRQFAVGDLPRHLLDQPAFLRGQPAQFAIGAGTGEFDQTQRADERRGQRPATDGKVQHRALRGGAIQRIVRDGQLSH